MILTEARSRDQRSEVLDMLHARAERLADLKHAIETGTYQLDSGRIAQAIIASGF